MKSARFLLVLSFAMLTIGALSFVEASPNVRGIYRGFFQSIGDPSIRGAVELNINFQEPPDPEFSGFLTLGSPLPFRFSGKVDPAGGIKGRGTGPDGSVTFTGKWMDQQEGAALVFATYKFVPVSGPTDQGSVRILRGYAEPPEPETPAHIGGKWEGTSDSALAGGRGNLCLQITQDRDPLTGRLGTAFAGTELVEAATRSQFTIDFVGTINAGGHFLAVGNGIPGGLLIGGQEPPVPDKPTRATYSLNYADGSVDIGNLEVHQTPPGPCSQ